MAILCMDGSGVSAQTGGEEYSEKSRDRGQNEHDPPQLFGIAVFAEPVVPGHGDLLVPTRMIRPIGVAVNHYACAFTSAKVSIRAGLSQSIVSIVAAGRPRSCSIGTKSRRTVA